MKATFIVLFAFSFFLEPLYAQIKPDTVRIILKTIPGMQYDQVRFSVKPGSHIRLVLLNTDEMEHNLVLGQKDSRQKIVDAGLALGKDGPSVGYIPKITEVLNYIPLLKSGESDSILFRAPRVTGVYPYVCTFPGHGGIMYGGMHVTNGIMPELSADLSVPQHRRVTAEGKSLDRPSGHPYPLTPPYLYRVLMPETGPAAIAVCLPKKLNYCWDAGSCRLRYIWSGAFLDLTDYWTIKGELNAKILSNIIYKDSTSYPFLVGNQKPQVKFKGYRLINAYPEFHYQWEGMDVYELIQTASEKSLSRHFRITGIDQTLKFSHSPGDGIKYLSNKGSWSGNQLTLSPGDAIDFTITMSKQIQ
ncbi:MAG: hypothetical protein IPG82_04715 [Saprospiraceae bacterium]|nr:hypothetical protein [Saprospiraceae bacterium]